jgi:hypothetical protein
MLKIAMCLCVSLVATNTLHAADAVQLDKLTQVQVGEALKTASDDTVIEYKGVSKTLAQWRSDFQVTHKPPDVAQLKQLAAERKTKFDADTKALQDQQDSDVAAQNAEVDKEFESESH